MLRPVSKVADMENRLGLASRYVDPVIQHRWRHYAVFVRDLVKVGSVSFAEDAVEHVGLFFVPKKAVTQRFIRDARASNRLFFETSIRAVAPLSDDPEDACGGTSEVQAATMLPTGAKSPCSRSGWYWTREEGLRQERDTAADKMTSSYGFRRSWCGAAMRFCHSFSALS